jgi:hypothetical protein
MIEHRVFINVFIGAIKSITSKVVWYHLTSDTPIVERPFEAAMPVFIPPFRECPPNAVMAGQKARSTAKFVSFACYFFSLFVCCAPEFRNN